MTASAETGSFVTGPSGGVLASELYVDDVNGMLDDHNDYCSWNAFSDDADVPSTRPRYVRAGLIGSVSGDESTGSWRLKPGVGAGVSAVNVGSDGATSPSCSPAASSTGSATA